MFLSKFDEFNIFLQEERSLIIKYSTIMQLPIEIDLAFIYSKLLPQTLCLL